MKINQFLAFVIKNAFFIICVFIAFYQVFDIASELYQKMNASYRNKMFSQDARHARIIYWAIKPVLGDAFADKNGPIDEYIKACKLNGKWYRCSYIVFNNTSEFNSSTLDKIEKIKEIIKNPCLFLDKNKISSDRAKEEVGHQCREGVNFEFISPEVNFDSKYLIFITRSAL